MSLVKRVARLERWNSLDLVFTNGTDVVSAVIRAIQKPNWAKLAPEVRRRARHDGYSHVALVLRSDVLDAVPEGETYLLESTMSGRLGDGIRAADGRAYFGVQLRRLDEVVEAYTGPLRAKGGLVARAAWQGPIPEDAKAKLNLLWRVWEGKRYDFHPLVLASSICPRLRPLRRLHSWFVPQDSAFFCSELVATVLAYLDLLPPGVSPDDVAPMDLVGWSDPPLDLPYGRVVELVP